ncbi:MAG: alpha/beta fold hydrolase [Persicimonas sp.]
MTPPDRAGQESVLGAERLANVVHGHGDDVYVGLHGWNGSHQTFEPLADRVPTTARLISLDLPGYGQSTGPTRWNLEAIADQIVSTLDEEIGPHTPVSLVGSCSGGVVALFVARLLGARTQRFIFVEPFAFVPGYLRIFLKPAVGRLFYYSAFGNPIGRFITNAALAGHRGDDTDMTASFARGSLEVPLEYLHLFDGIDRAESFADLPGQIELVHGEHTFDAIRESVDIWSEVWPEAVVEQIEGAGHLLLTEAPERVAEWVFRG